MGNEYLGLILLFKCEILLLLSVGNVKDFFFILIPGMSWPVVICMLAGAEPRGSSKPELGSTGTSRHHRDL